MRFRFFKLTPADIIEAGFLCIVGLTGIFITGQFPPPHDTLSIVLHDVARVGAWCIFIVGLIKKQIVDNFLGMP
jgi:hypothetical protein